MDTFATSGLGIVSTGAGVITENNLPIDYIEISMSAEQEDTLVYSNYVHTITGILFVGVRTSYDKVVTSLVTSLLLPGQSKVVLSGGISGGVSYQITGTLTEHTLLCKNPKTYNGSTGRMFSGIVFLK